MGAHTDHMDGWEFGQMVHRWRDRVVPEAVGIPVGRRRRATGLRREELAGLAGISADYLTRLEQGRATAPSAQVVEALATALRLSDTERETLYRLAGHVVPASGLVPSRITASVQRLLDRLTHTPVAVFDATLTLLVANGPYNALMGDTTTWRGFERNAIWRNLIGPGPGAVHTPEERAMLATGQVADLRLTATRYPADRSLRKLVAELAAGSARFRELWESADLNPPQAMMKRKVIDHPSVGRIGLDCDVLLVATDDVRIMMYTAEPGTEDAHRLELAIVLGTQTMADHG